MRLARSPPRRREQGGAAAWRRGGGAATAIACIDSSFVWQVDSSRLSSEIASRISEPNQTWAVERDPRMYSVEEVLIVACIEWLHALNVCLLRGIVNI